MKLPDTANTGRALWNITGTLIVSSALFLVAACAFLPEPHKVEVQQGNIIDASALSDLRKGMTRQQVRFLLGNPVISDPFHGYRWDYIYYVTPAGKAPETKRLTLYFKGDVLTRVLDRYTDHMVDTYLSDDGS